MCNAIIKLVLVWLCLFSVAEAQECAAYLPNKNSNDTLIRSLLTKLPIQFQDVVKDIEKYNVQIIYTQVNHAPNNQIGLSRFTYHLNSKLYFYPASLVKLPVSALALAYCNTNKIPSNTTMITLANGNCQQSVKIDTSAQNKLPSVAQYVKKMMLVSDNESYSRLYELLGADYIHEKLSALGMKKTHIVQRFDPLCNEAQNLVFNPVVFLNEKGDTIFKKPASKSEFYTNFNFTPQHKGKAFVNGKGKLIHQPRSFKQNNVMPLQEINNFLIQLIYPQTVPFLSRLQIDSCDYKMLLKSMCQYPRESDFPKYDPKKFEDTYKKYLLWADTHVPILEDTLRIFNIVGQSYGWLIDCAYFVDFKHKKDFFLSAVIYTNKNGIINDGSYEYKQIGFPFLSALGKLIYDYELSRERVFEADYSRFKIANLNAACP